QRDLHRANGPGRGFCRDGRPGNVQGAVAALPGGGPAADAQRCHRHPWAACPLLQRIPESASHGTTDDRAPILARGLSRPPAKPPPDDRSVKAAFALRPPLLLSRGPRLGETEKLVACHFACGIATPRRCLRVGSPT